MEPLSLPLLPLVLVFPEARLSTAEVYRTYDGVGPEEDARSFQARCRRSEEAWHSLSQAWVSDGLEPAYVCEQVSALLQNDLETAAFHLLPELPELKSRLEERGVLGTVMSGSGPTVFGISPSEEEAAAVVRSLDRDGIEARFVHAGAVT
ncbi:MAG: hypothetical protein Kow00122_21280 [Thermoleophilia bacterium]